MCLPGTRTSVLRKAEDWLHSDDPETSNILWIYGAPGAGKSAIATTLAKEFTRTRHCAKFSAKRDIADRRDPKRVWRTLAYSLAGVSVGLKGSIMEALSKKSPIFQHEFRDLIVKAVRAQQCLSVVFVLDALDECFTDDNEDWRDLLQSIAGWADLPWTFRLVVASRDIPDIRSTLEKISHSIYLTTGKEASLEDKSDTRTFLRAKFDSMYPNMLDGELLQQLTDYAAGELYLGKNGRRVGGEARP